VREVKLDLDALRGRRGRTLNMLHYRGYRRFVRRDWGKEEEEEREDTA